MQIGGFNRDAGAQTLLQRIHKHLRLGGIIQGSILLIRHGESLQGDQHTNIFGVHVQFFRQLPASNRDSSALTRMAERKS